MNSEYLNTIDTHFSYLPPSEREDVKTLIQEYFTLFGDVPSRTSVVRHDINVGNVAPIKQHPYQCPPLKRELMRKEVQYLLDNSLAVPSHSSWSSPCLLTPKSDGTPWFCTDFRRVNAVTSLTLIPYPTSKTA